MSKFLFYTVIAFNLCACINLLILCHKFKNIEIELEFEEKDE